MIALNPRDAELLAKILGRLGSDHEGEIAAAGAMAWRFIRERGLSWRDVIGAKLRPEPEQRPRTWHDDIRYCRDNDEFLTDWEQAFLSSIAMRWSLTPKQQAALDRITNKCRAFAKEN